jgi:tripartite-type tricarboxylate transporter receptor subunit TctC
VLHTMKVGRVLSRVAVAALCVAALPLVGARAADENKSDSVAQFYKGKTITIVIGSSPGGGYDLYGRLLARYIGQYIPGHPYVVPTNMSGAASVEDAQYIYASAPQDGTFIGLLYPGGVMEPLLGTKGPVRYDSTKFNYIGSANADAYVCVARADAPAKTLSDALRVSIVMGSSAGGGSTHDFPMLLNRVLGAKFKIVTGYPGSTEISLAIDKGEVQGACGLGWSSITAGHPQWLSEHSVNILAQENLTPNPQLAAMGVPLAISYAKTAEQRQIMTLIYAQPSFGRPFVMGPHVPPERVAAMRAAFQKALSSPEVVAEAKKEKLDLIPMWGGDLEKLVAQLYATPPDVVAKTKAAISDQK